MVLAGDERVVRERFFPKLARVLARVPFAEELVAAYYCAFDGATPLKAKGVLLAALAYFVLPLDTIPDFVLGLGFTDDLAVLLAAFNIVRTHVTEAHRTRARETLSRLKPGAAASA
ncbi:YkvA family protein [Aestuariivirga sp.]|uniref:YkvA family protein n=1 Tax=Aestuariivirga sp. TaxID=2650926 RepID=UPI003BAD88A6